MAIERDVYKAAREYKKKIQEEEGCLVWTHRLVEAFLAGAEWRVRSIWHDPVEKPEITEIIWVERPKNFDLMCLSDNRLEHWEERVAALRIKRWAYVKDMRLHEEGGDS